MRLFILVLFSSFLFSAEYSYTCTPYNIYLKTNQKYKNFRCDNTYLKFDKNNKIINCWVDWNDKDKPIYCYENNIKTYMEILKDGNRTKISNALAISNEEFEFLNGLAGVLIGFLMSYFFLSAIPDW